MNMDATYTRTHLAHGVMVPPRGAGFLIQNATTPPPTSAERNAERERKRQRMYQAGQRCGVSRAVMRRMYRRRRPGDFKRVVLAVVAYDAAKSRRRP